VFAKPAVLVESCSIFWFAAVTFANVLFETIVSWISMAVIAFQFAAAELY